MERGDSSSVDFGGMRDRLPPAPIESNVGYSVGEEAALKPMNITPKSDSQAKTNPVRGDLRKPGKEIVTLGGASL